MHTGIEEGVKVEWSGGGMKKESSISTVFGFSMIQTGSLGAPELSNIAISASFFGFFRSL